MRKVILIVDALNDFLKEDGALFFPNDIVGTIEQYLDENPDVIRVYLNEFHDEDDLEFKRFPKHGVKNTWGAQVVDELAPREGDIVIHKTRYSGFYGTDLDKVLEDLDPDEIVVVGCCTSICVLFTVIDMANRDYKNVSVLKDCVDDFNKKAGDFALQHMESVGGVNVIR